ncbi:Protein maternal effect lethal 26 [Halotydeus destructor]|nr:Protein maternal effect lethal 26 [Halotydeus destructor]
MNALTDGKTNSDNFSAPFYPPHSFRIVVTQKGCTFKAALVSQSLSETINGQFHVFILKCDGSRILVTDEYTLPGPQIDQYLRDGALMYFRVKIKLTGYEVSREHRGLLQLYESINKELSDFEIKANGGSVLVTKNILMIKWSYFKALMNSKCAEYSSNEWVVDDVGVEIMENIVGYVYCDAITFDDKDHVVELLKAGHRYLLPDLVSDCSKYLIAELTTGNALTMLVLSDIYDLDELKEKSSLLVIKALGHKDMKKLDGYVDYVKYANHSKLTEACFEKAAKQIVVLHDPSSLSYSPSP